MQLKVDLSEEETTIFKEIKKRKGYKKNTDTIRYIIKSAWDYENSSSIVYDILNKSQIDEIERLLARKDVQHKFFISDIRQFVNKAIETYYEEIKNSCKSILHWDVKSRLQGDEKEIAVAFGICQNESNTGEVTAREVAKLLDKRNIENIEKVLDSFVYQNMLEVMTVGDRKVYHASDI